LNDADDLMKRMARAAFYAFMAGLAAYCGSGGALTPNAVLASDPHGIEQGWAFH
jgi:hypothetical protein